MLTASYQITHMVYLTTYLLCMIQNKNSLSNILKFTFSALAVYTTVVMFQNSYTENPNLFYNIIT